MKKLVLLLVFIYLSNINYAQIVLPSMRVLGLPIPSPKSIFKGGVGYTTQSNFLLQSNCTLVFANNIFKGGSGYTSQSSSLLQSNCTPVYINNIFKGGSGYTTQSSSLLQSNCTPVYINNIFRGGSGYTSQSSSLLQSNCTPVYINNIFKGGSGYTSQSSSLLQSNCTPVYINNIFKGGSGFSSQNIFSFNYGMTLSLDAATYAGSGKLWNDQSSSANNASFVNTPTYNSANGGYFVFDGSNYATSFSYNISPAGNSRTINVWCNISSTSRMGLVGTRDDRHGTLNGWVLDLWGGDVRYYHTGKEVLTVNAVMSTNTWYMITATYNYATQTAEIYVNGVFKGTGSLTSDNNVPSIFNGVLFTEDFDAYPNNFIGKYATINIYNRVLSSSEIVSNFNSTKSRFGL